MRVISRYLLPQKIPAKPGSVITTRWTRKTKIQTQGIGFILTLNFVDDERLIKSVSSFEEIEEWRIRNGELFNFSSLMSSKRGSKREGILDATFLLNRDIAFIATNSLNVVSVRRSNPSGYDMFERHRAPISMVTFSPKTRLVASGSDDRTKKIGPPA